MSLLLRRRGNGGQPDQEERTVAENISRGGARVMTTWTGLESGDEIEVREVGGEFQTRAAVRGAFVGPDHIPRLNLEFLDRSAPSSLVGASAPAGGPEGRPVASVRKQPTGPSPPVKAPPPAAAVEARPAVSDAPSPASEAATPSPEEALPEPPPGAMNLGPPADVQSLEEELELRDEALRLFQSLKTVTHYELLDIPRDADSGAVRAGYARQVRRFHPDRARGNLKTLRAAFQTILVKLGDAKALLEDPGAKRMYDMRLGQVPQPRKLKPPTFASSFPKASAEPTPSASRTAAQRLKPEFSRPAAEPAAKPQPQPQPQKPQPQKPQPPPAPPKPEPAPAPVNAEADAVRAEKEIARARKLFEAEQYWDAIKALEGAIPHTQSDKLKQTMSVLLARATAKNPKWLRRAEEILLEITRSDPRHVEAHYELGRIYSAGGLTTRAQRMYRRVLELEPSHKAAAAELHSLMTTRPL